MGSDSTLDRTPWAWFRGFAWFLLAWPLVALAGIDELADEDLETITAVILGPALIGVVLMGVERALTLTLGRRMAARLQPAPSTLRDLPNTALALMVLLLTATGLGLLDDGPLFSSPEAASAAALLLGGSSAVALLFRAVHTWRHGGGRQVDLGPAW